MGNEQFGLLTAFQVELPYKNAKEQAKADALNEQLKGMGFRTFRAAYDWGYKPYDDLATNILKKDPQAQHIKNKVTPLKSGDLVKVFNTISAGDVHWQGKVKFNCKDYHHGLQEGMATKDWSLMFNEQLPARMERNGKVIFGALEPFCETGTEGVIWSIQEYGKAGYDGLNALENGDLLTVYSTVTDGNIDWEGPVDFGPEKVTKISYSEIMRQPKHMGAGKWLEMSWQRRPVVVTPGP